MLLGEDGAGVFEWVKSMLRFMENNNIHVNVLATRIWRGDFMTEARGSEIREQQLQCEYYKDGALERRAFEQVEDRDEVEDSVLWLEALLIWIMQRYGRNEILLDAHEQLSKLKLTTRSLAGVGKLFGKVRQLMCQLSEESRVYTVFEKYFADALERNPYIDPSALVREFHTQRQLAELSLGLNMSRARFKELSDEQKFDHIRRVVEEIKNSALERFEDGADYSTPGLPMSNTNEDALRRYKAGQQQDTSREGRRSRFEARRAPDKFEDWSEKDSRGNEETEDESEWEEDFEDGK